MAGKLDYQWRLRHVMAEKGMFATTDLIEPLAQRGIHLSSSQVYRLVAERPERLSLKALMALLDILDCTMDELIEPPGPPRSANPRPPAKARPGSAAFARNGPESPPSIGEPCPLRWRRR
jgi:DNA-binding Xre family transcriptional regulator